MEHNAATNQIVVFVKVDETFMRYDSQGHLRLGQGQEMTSVPLRTIFFTFLALAYPGSPGQRAIKRVLLVGSKNALLTNAVI